MARSDPVEPGDTEHFGRRFYAARLFCKRGLGVYQVYLCQKLVRPENLGHVGTYLVGEYRQYAYDFAALGGFQLAHLVVRLHHLRRLDEYGLSRGRLIVYDAVDAAFHLWCHGDHQPAVAHGGGCILVHKSVFLSRVQYSI